MNNNDCFVCGCAINQGLCFLKCNEAFKCMGIYINQEVDHSICSTCQYMLTKCTLLLTDLHLKNTLKSCNSCGSKKPLTSYHFYNFPYEFLQVNYFKDLNLIDKTKLCLECRVFLDWASVTYTKLIGKLNLSPKRALKTIIEERERFWDIDLPLNIDRKSLINCFVDLGIKIDASKYQLQTKENDSVSTDFKSRTIKNIEKLNQKLVNSSSNSDISDSDSSITSSIKTPTKKVSKKKFLVEETSSSDSEIKRLLNEAMSPTSILKKPNLNYSSTKKVAFNGNLSIRSIPNRDDLLKSSRGRSVKRKLNYSDSSDYDIAKKRKKTITKTTEITTRSSLIGNRLRKKTTISTTSKISLKFSKIKKHKRLKISSDTNSGKSSEEKLEKYSKLKSSPILKNKSNQKVNKSSSDTDSSCSSLSIGTSKKTQNTANPTKKTTLRSSILNSSQSDQDKSISTKEETLKNDMSPIKTNASPRKILCEDDNIMKSDTNLKSEPEKDMKRNSVVNSPVRRSIYMIESSGTSSEDNSTTNILKSPPFSIKDDSKISSKSDTDSMSDSSTKRSLRNSTIRTPSPNVKKSLKSEDQSDRLRNGSDRESPIANYSARNKRKINVIEDSLEISSKDNSLNNISAFSTKNNSKMSSKSDTDLMCESSTKRSLRNSITRTSSPIVKKTPESENRSSRRCRNSDTDSPIAMFSTKTKRKSRTAMDSSEKSTEDNSTKNNSSFPTKDEIDPMSNSSTKQSLRKSKTEIQPPNAKRTLISEDLSKSVCQNTNTGSPVAMISTKNKIECITIVDSSENSDDPTKNNSTRRSFSTKDNSKMSSKSDTYLMSESSNKRMLRNSITGASSPIVKKTPESENRSSRRCRNSDTDSPIAMFSTKNKRKSNTVMDSSEKSIEDNFTKNNSSLPTKDEIDPMSSSTKQSLRKSKTEIQPSNAKRNLKSEDLSKRVCQNTNTNSPIAMISTKNKIECITIVDSSESSDDLTKSNSTRRSFSTKDNSQSSSKRDNNLMSISSLKQSPIKANTEALSPNSKRLKKVSPPIRNERSLSRIKFNRSETDKRKNFESTTGSQENDTDSSASNECKRRNTRSISASTKLVQSSEPDPSNSDKKSKKFENSKFKKRQSKRLNPKLNKFRELMKLITKNENSLTPKMRTRPIPTSSQSENTSDWEEDSFSSDSDSGEEYEVKKPQIKKIRDSEKLKCSKANLTSNPEISKPLELGKGDGDSLTDRLNSPTPTSTREKRITSGSPIVISSSSSSNNSPILINDRVSLRKASTSTLNISRSPRLQFLNRDSIKNLFEISKKSQPKPKLPRKINFLGNNLFINPFGSLRNKFK